MLKFLFRIIFISLILLFSINTIAKCINNIELKEYNLGDLIRIENIKGYFIANEVCYPPENVIYVPNKNYEFFILIFTNFNTPFVIESYDLDSLMIINTKNEQVTCDMFAVNPPDEKKNIQLTGTRKGRNVINCEIPNSMLDISFFFILPINFGDLTLKYKGIMFSLKQIELALPSNTFGTQCSLKVEEGTWMGGILKNTHPKGTDVLYLNELNPNDYKLKVDEIDISSCISQFGIKVSIKNINNIPIKVISIDPMTKIEVICKEQLNPIPSIGFLTDHEAEILPFKKELFKVLTPFNREKSIEITQYSSWGAETVSWYNCEGSHKPLRLNPYTDEGIAPGFFNDTIKMEFIFNRNSANFLKLNIGQYCIDLTSANIK